MGQQRERGGFGRRPPVSAPLPAGKSVELDAGELLSALLRRADRDRDGRITGSDVRGAGNGRSSFQLKLGPGLELWVQGAERLSQLASVLGSEARKRNGLAPIDLNRLLEGRVDAALDAVARAWGDLARSVQSIDGLLAAVGEGRTRAADGKAYLYVPESDPEALARLRREAKGRRQVRVVALPRARGAREHEALARNAGVAYLPRPYVVPGDRFREMYGWDSYFHARGALAAGRLDLAQDLAENQIYAVRHYGKVPNSNRSYHLSRSQPPFLAPLVAAVHSELATRREPGAREFLRRGIAAIQRELHGVWDRAPRRTDAGLSRYFDEAEGPCPEVPAAFYSSKPRTREYCRHDRALRESGWDLTHRFGRAAHQHAPVCLNSLLYRAESDLAELWQRLEGPKSRRASDWLRRAASRRRRIDALLWDARAGLYFDLDLRTGRLSTYETLATFYPLWAGAASQRQADAVARGVDRFLVKGGLVTSTAESRRRGGPEKYQWDHPIGWAPLQVLAVEGLRRYGHAALADEIAYRWLWMVLRIFGQNNGLIKEKYDVVHRTVEVSAEYVNQGNDRGRYTGRPSREALGFGWTNASIPLLLAGLSPKLRRELDLGTYPRRLFPERL